MLFVEHILYLEKPRESADRLGKLKTKFSKKKTVYVVNENISRFPIHQQ